VILRPLRFVHPVLQRTQTELKTQKKNYADVASCKFFARHLCRSSARKQSIWRVFQTGGYAAFSSICLSCFGLRIVFHYGPAYPMENASALPSPRFEMLSRNGRAHHSTAAGPSQSGYHGPLLRIANTKVCSTTSPLDLLPQPVAPEPKPAPPQYF
jgi:hypothetical protein